MSRVPLLALVGSKGGPDDGRPFPPLEPGPMPESGLHMAGSNALLAAMTNGVTPPGTDATRHNRQEKDLLGLYRRRQRLAMDIHLGRDRTDEDVRRAREAGLLPGAPAKPGQLQFTGPGGGTNFDGEGGINVGRQLANIRWHGHPDGPVDAHGAADEMAAVNALRAAALRAGRRPNSSLYTAR